MLVWVCCYFFNVDIDFWSQLMFVRWFFFVFFSSSRIHNGFHRPSIVAFWFPICSLLKDMYVFQSFRFHLVANWAKSVDERGRNIYVRTHITEPPCFFSFHNSNETWKMHFHDAWILVMSYRNSNFLFHTEWTHLLLYVETKSWKLEARFW